MSSFSFSVALQDWGSVWSVHAAHRRWVLGHVDRFTLQWWEPSSGQVRVCALTLRFLTAAPLCSLTLPLSLSILQYINQRLKHRERWVGALTSTFIPREYAVASDIPVCVWVCEEIRGWLLCWPNTFLRCINPAAWTQDPLMLSCLPCEELTCIPSVILSSGGGILLACLAPTNRLTELLAWL